MASLQASLYADAEESTSSPSQDIHLTTDIPRIIPNSLGIEKDGKATPSYLTHLIMSKGEEEEIIFLMEEFVAGAKKGQ